MSNELYVHHHLGLGDHIDCNAMIRIFLEEYDFDVVNVFAKERYSDMKRKNEGFMRS